jgi:hypothetical protein
VPTIVSTTTSGSAFFLDEDTRHAALAPHIINLIVDISIIKLLAKSGANTLHVDRSPAILHNCPLLWQSARDHVIHDGFHDLRTVGGT